MNATKKWMKKNHLENEAIKPTNGKLKLILLYIHIIEHIIEDILNTRFALIIIWIPVNSDEQGYNLIHLPRRGDKFKPWSLDNYLIWMKPDRKESFSSNPWWNSQKKSHSVARFHQSNDNAQTVVSLSWKKEKPSFWVKK